MLFSFLRIAGVTVLLFTLSACGSGGSGDSESGGSADRESGGSGDSGSGDGSGSSSAPVIKFLSVNDGVHGFELWKTDGSTVGTVLVKDINTAAGASSNPVSFGELNGVVYFNANDGVNGDELWKTDGTAAGTVLLKDINITTVGADSSPRNFTVFNGELYFRANDGLNGHELWKTDGTAAGTVWVQSINMTKAAASSYPGEFTVFNGALYFSANDGVHDGRILGRTGGTAASTTRVEDICTDAGAIYNVSDLIVFKGALYFSANDGVHGTELWKTDGTTAGPVLVKNINTTTDSNWGGWSSSPLGFTIFNDELYFQANDGVHGNVLWKTDGTAAGTMSVRDINTATAPIPQLSRPQTFIVFNGALYFTADDGGNSGNFWKTDGTDAGTVRVTDIPGTSFISTLGITVFGDALYFITNDGNNGYDLWKTDGTTTGTVLVKNFTGASPYPWQNNYPFNFTELNGVLYFQADDGVNGIEAWKTDGTTAGTLLLKDICPGVCDGFWYY